jgi:hypothetical protein
VPNIRKKGFPEESGISTIIVGSEDCIVRDNLKMLRRCAGLGLAVLVGTIAVVVPVGNASIANEGTVSLLPPLSVSIAGRTLATIDDGDAMNPTFSPDDRFLAYSVVIVENGLSKTAVRIFDLRLQKVVTTIEGTAINVHDEINNSTIDIKWPQENRLIVRVGNGDDAIATLTFDPQTRQQISRIIDIGGDENPVRERENAALIATWQREIIALAPRVDRAALKVALENENRRIIAGKKAILIGRLFDGEYNVWSFDVQGKVVRKFVLSSRELTEISYLYPAIGTPNDALFFTVNTPGEGETLQTRYVVHKNGDFQEILTPTGVPNVATLKVVRSTPQRTILLGYPDFGDREVNHPLYVWENDLLSASRDAANLTDASTSNRGDWIALCLWQNGKRQIAIKELLR